MTKFERTPRFGSSKSGRVVFDFAISRKRCEIELRWQLITNKKSYRGFRLQQKSMTLNDLEQRRNSRLLSAVLTSCYIMKWIFKVRCVSKKTCHCIFDCNSCVCYNFCTVVNRIQSSTIRYYLLTWRLDDVITVTHRTSRKFSSELHVKTKHVEFEDKMLIKPARI